MISISTPTEGGRASPCGNNSFGSDESSRTAFPRRKTSRNFARHRIKSMVRTGKVQRNMIQFSAPVTGCNACHRSRRLVSVILSSHTQRIVVYVSNNKSFCSLIAQRVMTALDSGSTNPSSFFSLILGCFPAIRCFGLFIASISAGIRPCLCCGRSTRRGI